MGKVETNENGVDLIKSMEGFSSSVYLCPAYIFTIGFGSLHGLNGDRLNRDHRDITHNEGTELLKRDLLKTEYFVAKLVRVPLTINQFSALVSLVFNIGSGNFQNSTLRMKLNRRDYQGCADNFWQWRRGGGRILTGLVRRRELEKQLFLS
jgi:lysozyme